MEMNVPDFDFERSFFLGVVNIPVNGYEYFANQQLYRPPQTTRVC
jgi:hypothetical protein